MAEVDNGLLRTIRSELATMSSQIYNLDSVVSDVRSDVGRITDTLDTTHEELTALRIAFENYVAQAERVAAVQRAETRRGNLEAELERQYGHYAVVRRTSVGVMQAFDVGNVSDDVVAHVSEEIMIQSPRYWLAPALVGIAAWSRDDKEIAERSINEAFKRDAAKTSLFFALVLRRTGRLSGAVRWLRHYLKNCKSDALTRDFAVILEASAQGAFGSDGALLLSETIYKWTTDLRTSEKITQAQIDEWEAEILTNSQTLASDEYIELKSYCPEFHKLSAMLGSATALGETRKKYLAVREDQHVAPGFVADLLDDLLEQLVTEYDEEELPLRREVAFNQAIVETDGDMKRAQEIADEYHRALEETIDAVSLQTRTAISPELMGVSVQTQKVSIGIGQQDFLEGLNEYTRSYRSKAINQATIVLDRNHSNAGTTFGFIGHTSTTSEPEDAVFERLQREWEQTFQEYIDSMQFAPGKYYAGAGIALLFSFLLTMVSIGFALLMLLVSGGIIAWKWNEDKKKSENAIAEAEKSRSDAYEDSRMRIVAARAAFVDMMIEYETLEDEEQALRDLINTWPTVVLEQNSAIS